MIELFRKLSLPGVDGFYADNREFEVEVVGAACGAYTEVTATFRLDLEPLMQTLLTPFNGAVHEASLGAISESALRFYRTRGIKTWAFEQYRNELFILRHGFGNVWATTASNSICPMPYDESTRHAEARRQTTELFSYGLAVNFVAEVLGIPSERFFFLTGNGARPDFAARVTARELLARGASIHAVNAAGHVVRLEVKARTRWASFRHSGSQGRALLLDLARKSSADPGKLFLGILIAIPAPGTTARGATKILVADPGRPEPIAPEEQALTILRELLFFAHRYSLWKVAGDILGWISSLGGKLEANELELQARLPELIQAVGPAAEQLKEAFPNVSHSDGKREFVGAVFGSLLDQAGVKGDRGLTREQAEQAIRYGDIGTYWFRGIDDELLTIVSKRELKDLLNYGVRGKYKIDLSGQSGFWVQRLPANREADGIVRDRLREQIPVW